LSNIPVLLICMANPSEKGIDVIQETVKQLLGLCTALIAAGAGFAKEVVEGTTTIAKWVFILALVLICLSMVFGIATLMGMIGVLTGGAPTTAVPTPVPPTTFSSPYGTSFARWFKWHFICFVIGILGLILFCGLRVFQSSEPPKPSGAKTTHQFKTTDRPCGTNVY